MVKETLTVRIQLETMRALDAIAAAVNRDRSHVVNEVLAAYVETHRWQMDHIRQGLRDAEAGRFATACKVNRVIARLRLRGTPHGSRRWTDSF